MSTLGAFHFVAIVGLAYVVAQICLNRRALPRLLPAAGGAPQPGVSVLIPARDEAAKIAACLRGWMAQEYADFEVLVYDDDSTDGTAAVAAAAGGARVRIVRGGPLPAGWRGKPWACHRLRTEASGALLVFADADVTPAPRALSAVADVLAATRSDVLSALPRHTGRGPLLRSLAGIQSWAAAAFVPLWLARAARRRTFAALNGQFLAMPAAAYDAFGGFAAVRASVAEDVELGRLLAERAMRSLLVDGSAVLRCEPYASLREAWRGNVRNLVPIFFGSAGTLLAAAAALAALYLVPPGLLAAAAFGAGPSSARLWLPVAELALALLGRWLVDARFGTAGLATLLHPLAVAGLVAMSVGSVLQHRVRRAVDWRGRRYSVSAGD